MPWLLVPFYAGCPRTCSPLVDNVRRAVESLRQQGERFGVVLVSVDPNESTQRLEEFRARLQLPDDWLLLRAQTRTVLRNFLIHLDIVTVTLEQGEIDHPNLVFVVSPQNLVVAVLPGLAPLEASLSKALHQAWNGPPVRHQATLYLFLALATSVLTLVVAWSLRRFGETNAGTRTAG